MYTAANDHNPKRKLETFKEVILYGACASIQGEENGIVFKIRFGKQELVAFWCSYDKKIKAGFQASEYERKIIEENF